MFMRGQAKNSSSTRLAANGANNASSNGSNKSIATGQQEFEFYAFKKNQQPVEITSPSPVNNNSNSANNSRSSLSSQQRPTQQPLFDDETIFELDKLIQLFAMCDQDNDDYVTRADFVRVSHSIGGLPPLLVAQLDRVLPPNSPGLRVSLHELVTMARNFGNSNSHNAMPLLQPISNNSTNNNNNGFAGSSPVKLKRYDNSNAPLTPNSTPDQQFVDCSLQQAKWQQQPQQQKSRQTVADADSGVVRDFNTSSSEEAAALRGSASNSASPVPTHQQQSSNNNFNKASTATHFVTPSATDMGVPETVARLQREKESLEVKLTMLQTEVGRLRSHGGRYGADQLQQHLQLEDQIANLQSLISKYHQQIYVAAELQKQNNPKQLRTPPTTNNAPQPPPRRVPPPPVQHQQVPQPQPQQLQQQQRQLAQSQPSSASASRLATVNVQHCAPTSYSSPINGQPVNGYPLEQIDEASQPESADDQDVTCSSGSSSSESEEVAENRRNRRRHRHARQHRPSKQFTNRQPEPQLQQQQYHQMPAQQHQPAAYCDVPPQGAYLDIDAVDNAFQQQEQLLTHLKQQLVACMNDRDRYKKLAQDFYRRIQYQKTGSDLPCSPTTPMMESHNGGLPSTPCSSRMAEVRQVPRLSSVSPMLMPLGLTGDSSMSSMAGNITAADISANQCVLSTPLAEHLVEETEHAAVIQELVQSLAASGCRIPSERLAEFAAELECRSSKADRLRAAADLLASSLAKQRQHAANLAAALARSEETQNGLRMALECAMQKADAVSALLKLSESEQLLLLAHCRAVGVGQLGEESSLLNDSAAFEDQQSILLRQAVAARRQAEIEAQRLLSRLDNSCGILGPSTSSGTSSAVGGELLSSNNSNSSPRATGTCSSTGTTSSRTTDPASSSGQPDGDHCTSSSGVGSTVSSWSSLDEQRLREYAAQLDRDVQAMHMTLNDPVLESAAVAAVHTGVNSANMLANTSLLDSPLPLSSLGTTGSGGTAASNKDSLIAQHLETAVLVQELATLKEQRAESKTQCFILEREKRALEAELKARDQQATILRVQLEQTRMELDETTARVRKLEEAVREGCLSADRANSSSGDEGSSSVHSELAEALQREKRLRARIQELVDTLEMVGRSAEKQICEGGVDLVSELRKANSTLSDSYERARKKQDQRVKRLETQLGAVTSRYETKISLLKKQVALLEETANIGQSIDGHSFAPEAHL